MSLDQVYNGKSIDEVIALLHKYGKEAKIIAGGTDIVIALRNSKISPKVLIDISKIEELKNIEDDGEYIRIGGGVTFTQIVESPLFHGNLYGFQKACRMVGSPQIRSKGTVGGNIANGSAAADSIPPLMALEAIVQLESKDGVREISLEEYYYDQVREDELLTFIKFKKPNKDQILSFAKLGLRKALAISRLTIAALIEFNGDNTIKSSKVASGALGKYPMREKELEEYLFGKKINDKTIVFNVEYSKRKKITLDINPEGYVTVKAPSKTPEAEVLEFVKSKSKSILSFHEKMQERRFISREKSYHEEETFLYLGEACKLSDLIREIPESKDDTQVLIKKFYTSRTQEIIKKRVKHFEKIVGVKAKSITVVDSKFTWGTCNYHRELTFNYRLSMAPPDVIDYVVIHELCHILHLNHDRSFWRKVGSFDTDYKKKQDYLERFGGFMTI